jgi:hypothetical protein
MPEDLRPEIVSIIEQMKKMVGYIPTGTVDLLYVLIHPQMMDKVQELLDSCKQEDSQGIKR